MHKRYLHEMYMMARDVQPFASARLASCIVYKNNILAYGINRDKTHPFQRRFGKNALACYWHSETNAIFNAIKAGHTDLLPKATLYVARAKQEKPDLRFVQGLAKPCSGCQYCIDYFDIRRTVYTLDMDGYEVC